MQSKTKDNLTDEHVRATLLKDKGREAQLVSWTTENLNKKSDDSVGVVASIKVNYKLDMKENQDTYIVKLIPIQSMKALRDMLAQGCRKEFLFYQELLPALDTEMRNASLDPLRVPRCLHVNQDPEKSLLIMSDLRAQGFERYKERTCLDVKHASLILQELAKLHASSFILEAKIGHSNFNVRYDFLEKEWYNVTEDAIAFFKTLYDGNIENAVAIVQNMKCDLRVIEWLRKIKPNVYEILEEQMARDSAFTTLCHGDCISTNMLFRYNTDGNPVEVILLDFQQVRKASLVTDISLLLYICLSGTDRINHLDVLLQSYFSSFKNVIDASGHQMPFTFQQLMQEYKNKVMFGVLWGISVIPMLAGGIEVGDWSETQDKEDEVDAEATIQEKKIDFKSKGKDAELKNRFMPIFDELMDRGIIS